MISGNNIHQITHNGIDTWPGNGTNNKNFEIYNNNIYDFGGANGAGIYTPGASYFNIHDNDVHDTTTSTNDTYGIKVGSADGYVSEASTLLLDEPTNHLDADSIVWLRGYLATHKGGLVVISHDVGLLDSVVNKVFHLDANRCVIDVYNVGWTTYLKQRETDEKRRHRERANAEKQAAVLQTQADKMRAKATKARAAHSMEKRAERLLSGLEDQRANDRVAKLRFPEPVACGRTPLRARELSKSYGSLEVFVDVELAIDRGARVVILGLNGAGKTTLLRILAGVEDPDTGEVLPGHGLRLGYYAQEHDTLDPQATVLDNMLHAAGDMSSTECRSVLGQFLFTGDDVDKPAHVLSGGREDPPGAGHARGVRRQRPAARRADQQPRPGQPRGGPRRAGRPTRVRSSS